MLPKTYRNKDRNLSKFQLMAKNRCMIPELWMDTKDKMALQYSGFARQTKKSNIAS